jgi:hypothetical protein
MIDIKRRVAVRGIFASDPLDAQGVATKNTAQAPGAKKASVI